MNVRFYSLSSLPTANAGAAGSFVHVTAGENAGMWYCTGSSMIRLDNIAQDFAGEVKSATVDTTTGVASFKNASGDELFTLTLADYIAAEVAKLTGSATIASEADGVVTIKTGVAEADGKISNAEGTDITLAKVATTGKAADITLDPTVQFGSESSATVQDALEDIVAAFNDLAEDANVEMSTADATDGNDYTFTQAGETLGTINVHAHANKAELDKIADGDKAKWDAKQDAFDNADVLSAITATQVSAWDAKQDAFDNAEVLASITSDQVSSWDDAAADDTKATKVTNATAGNFAGLDENGNLTDSGKKAADFEVAGAAAAVQGETTSTVAGVEARVSALENDDTCATAISELSDRLDTIEGEGEGSIKKAAADAIAAVVAGADSDFDTLKEVADWIANDKEGVAALQNTVADNTTAISGLQSGLADAETAHKNMTDRLDALESLLGNSSESEEDSLIDRVAELENTVSDFREEEDTPIESKDIESLFA